MTIANPVPSEATLNIGRRVAILEDEVAGVKVTVSDIALAMTQHSDALVTFSRAMDAHTVRADKQTVVMESLGGRIEQGIVFQTKLLDVQRESLPINLVLRMMVFFSLIISGTVGMLLGIKEYFHL